MSTSVATAPRPRQLHPRPVGAPRVWLVGGGREPDPVFPPPVSDGMRLWDPGPDGLMHTRDGWHHATWLELRARFDLVEATHA